MHEKTVNSVGWFASIMAIGMYFSYIDQILLNISGHPGSILLPVVTVINCTAWTIYGFLKPQKDYPIIVCNIPGILLGSIAAFTAL
ncbi:MAG: SemiSWEET family transporter [Candidatus Peregrinibacteria bacterium]